MPQNSRSTLIVDVQLKGAHTIKLTGLELASRPYYKLLRVASTWPATDQPAQIHNQHGFSEGNSDLIF